VRLLRFSSAWTRTTSSITSVSALPAELTERLATDLARTAPRIRASCSFHSAFSSSLVNHPERGDRLPSSFSITLRLDTHEFSAYYALPVVMQLRCDLSGIGCGPAVEYAS